MLARRSYPGTSGDFLGLKEDVDWADIRERNAEIRSHPVIWLAYSANAAPGAR